MGTVASKSRLRRQSKPQFGRLARILAHYGPPLFFRQDQRIVVFRLITLAAPLVNSEPMRFWGASGGRGGRRVGVGWARASDNTLQTPDFTCSSCVPPTSAIAQGGGVPQRQGEIVKKAMSIVGEEPNPGMP
jgi:hypothetical protein